MTRRIAYLLVVCLFAQLSTGCCILQRVAQRIRSCHGCYPQFNTPGYGGHARDGGAGYGGDCASCDSGYGAASYGASPMVYGPGAAPPSMPGPTSYGLPMPAATPDKKN